MQSTEFVFDSDICAHTCCDPNAAFLKPLESDDSDDEDNGVIYPHSVDLDTAFIVGSDSNKALMGTCNGCRSDDYFDDPGVIFDTSVDPLEQNITSNAFVRHVFGATDKDSVVSEDSEMDSFMRSRSSIESI